jgi:hydrogenase-4 component B
VITAAGILLVAAGGLWIGAALLGALLGPRPGGVGLGGRVSAAGGACALVGGVLVVVHGAGGTRSIGGSNVVGALVLRVEPLAVVFVALLGVVALAIGLYAPRYHTPARGTAAYLLAYNLALLASLGVLVAGNATAFLVAWESTTVLSYLLILRRHREPGVARAAFLFLALGEVGFALIVAAFAILWAQTGTLDFGEIAARAGQMPVGWRDAAFVLALVGFGFKAGVVPLHIWLPEAHPVAPADGSAFLSGLVIKLGVYGIMLVSVDLLAGGPAWWGLLVMALGALSAVLGILYGLMERDLKRFLAFSSIENIGIVLTALGAGLTFSATGQSALGAFLLIAALYQAVNHGVSKTLLFLEAGVLEHAARSRDLDRLGGLIHRLPASAVISLVGTLGIAALPPLNGFVSEWLIFQGLFQGFRIPSHFFGILIVVAGACLALTAGLAVMAFARAFGLPFLGMPRSRGAAQATERSQPLAGPGVLAAACVALGIGAPLVLTALDRAARAATGTDVHSRLIIPNLTVIPAHTDFAAFSPPYLAVFLIAVSIVPVVIFIAGRPRGASARVPVWDGGILAFKARMQYTATTFANPVRVTFEGLYRPERHVERASDDPAGRSGPVHYHFRVLPLFERYLYAPVVRFVRWLADLVRPIQSGDVNLYLLYVFLAVIVAYLIYAY